MSYIDVVDLSSREPTVNLESKESREKLDRRETPGPPDLKGHLVPLDLQWVSLLTCQYIIMVHS